MMQGGDMVQAMRKAPLSRALAKSREERERERGMRSGKETKGRGGPRIKHSVHKISIFLNV